MDLVEEYNVRIKPLRDIIGAAFESANWFGHGLQESAYEVGMVEELRNKGYTVKQQEEFTVFYKGKQTQKKYRMDLVVETPRLGDIVIELKALNIIEDKQRKQLQTYMKLINARYGIIINFSPKGVYSEKYEYDSSTNFCHRITL